MLNVFCIDPVIIFQTHSDKTLRFPIIMGNALLIYQENTVHCPSELLGQTHPWNPGLFWSIIRLSNGTNFKSPILC